MEKLKNETVATFYDVYGVFDPNFGHFVNLPSGLKVIDLFKAKKVTFRERNCEKVESGSFFKCHKVRSTAVALNK